MIFTCTGFTGYWPVGTAAVVQAESLEAAVLLLRRALAAHGLQRAALETLDLIPLGENEARILCDGNY